jgi:hypothetical protein
VFLVKSLAKFLTPISRQRTVLDLVLGTQEPHSEECCISWPKPVKLEPQVNQKRSYFDSKCDEELCRFLLTVGAQSPRCVVPGRCRWIPLCFSLLAGINFLSSCHLMGKTSERRSITSHNTTLTVLCRKGEALSSAWITLHKCPTNIFWMIAHSLFFGKSVETSLGRNMKKV